MTVSLLHPSIRLHGTVLVNGVKLYVAITEYLNTVLLRICTSDRSGILIDLRAMPPRFVLGGTDRLALLFFTQLVQKITFEGGIRKPIILETNLDDETIWLLKEEQLRENLIALL